MNQSHLFDPNEYDEGYKSRKIGFILRIELGIWPMPETEEEMEWLTEWLDAHPEYEQQCADDLRQMETESLLSWYSLASYLRDQVRKGKTEFRLSSTGHRKFVIRPFGKDSETLEIKV